MKPSWSRPQKTPTPTPTASIPLYGVTPTSALEAQATTAYNARNWPLAERLYLEIIASADQGSVMFARNRLGMVLERVKRIDEAIKLYEANVRDGIDIPDTYLHLAIIYRRRSRTADEVRILERGIAVLRQAYGIGAGAELMLRLAKLQAKG